MSEDDIDLIISWPSLAPSHPLWFAPHQLPWSQIKKSMPSMGSQYLIKQHLHTQPGNRNVHLTVHSTDWHAARSLITCGDAGPHPPPAGATDRGYDTHTLPVTDILTNKESKCREKKAFRDKPFQEYSFFCNQCFILSSLQVAIFTFALICGNFSVGSMWPQSLTG